MSKQMQLNIRVSGPLSEHVEQRIGEGGNYENVGEYLRDLIRQDKNRQDELAFQHLKAELQLAFNAPETDAQRVSLEDVIARNTQ